MPQTAFDSKVPNAVTRLSAFLFLCFSTVCGPVGVEDKIKIPDARMTASTYLNSKYYAYYGRLNENRGMGAWCSKETRKGTDYLQVDMGTVHSVCALATQGEKGGSLSLAIITSVIK